LLKRVGCGDEVKGEAVGEARLLIGDAEQGARESYARLLSAAGHRVETAATGTEVLERVREQQFDMLFINHDVPPTDGVQLLHEIKKISASILVVLFSGAGSVQHVLGAFRAGAYEFLETPIEREQLLALADRAVSISQMGQQRRAMAEDLANERNKVLDLRAQLTHEDPFHDMLGCSTAFNSLLETIREVARTDSTVLLTGESGTGKGLVARMIHAASTRKDQPFVMANCVVYSEGVLHSELFGHEKGAFTGAARTKKGRFELAHGGTLFLDEIGEITAATQLMLLRVLQDRTFERVGGEETLETDVRMIAATNQDLQRAIEQGHFRSDLFYRLNVIPIHLSPLRERSEDIPILVEHFIAKCSARTGHGIEAVSREAMDALVHYPWPGNVRELENMMERIVVLNHTGSVDVPDLPDGLRDIRAKRNVNRLGTLHELERQRIIDALKETEGNKKRAAQELGIHRSTLYAKMRRYAIAIQPTTDESPEPAGVRTTSK
jgi:DNA-binding NtrC family response regulator